MKKETKNVNSGIITVSLFVICTAAVLWRRYGTDDLKNPVSAQPRRDSLLQQKRQFIYNSRVYLPAIRLANDGDIVFCKCTNPITEISHSPDQTDTSHCSAGIISRENDTVFVYHASGSEINTDQKIVREPLWNFGLPESNEALGLYRFETDTIKQKRVIDIVRAAYRQQFYPNAAFAPVKTDSVCGMELVSFCFEKALGKPGLFHRSQTNGRMCVTADDIISSSGVQKLAAWKY